jgi:hypothetical protein
MSEASENINKPFRAFQIGNGDERSWKNEYFRSVVDARKTADERYTRGWVRECLAIQLSSGEVFLIADHEPITIK